MTQAAEKTQIQALDMEKGFFLDKESFIYILRFSADSLIDNRNFCNDLQNILYDDIGSVGHFRLAPKDKEYLTESTLLGGPLYQLYPRKPEELFVAFLIRADNRSIAEELKIIPKELDQFCVESGHTWEQVSIDDLY